ncbi:MAG: hypothetical protein JOS17DRAFT_545064 [Linnemannia elongata]|nr:MAG: hypothetical protein JOS17DRAFT_545064 [Linnemannia elongata]
MSPTPSIPTSTATRTIKPCFPSPTSSLSPILLHSTPKHHNTMISTTSPPNKAASSSPSPSSPKSTSMSPKKPTLTTAPLPPSTMTKPPSPTSLSPCSRDVTPRVMSVPVAQINTSPVITSTVPNINSDALTSTTVAHGRRSRSRSRNASTSTPPPSPPLSASDTAHKEGRNGSIDTHTRQRNTLHHLQQRNQRYGHHLTSVQVSTAAAAAAAASYTSQELAIAYSMVTSSVQETGEEGESKAVTSTDQGPPKQPGNQLITMGRLLHILISSLSGDPSI